LLRDDAFPDLRDRLTRLNLLFASLDGAEKSCRENGAPSADKLQGWQRSLLAKTGLRPEDVSECLYATPARWATLGGALDRAAIRRAGSLMTVEGGEKKFRDKDYGSARKLFEAVLSADASCVRALEGLALTQAALNDHKEAVRRCREAVRAGATDPRTF